MINRINKNRIDILMISAIAIMVFVLISKNAYAQSVMSSSHYRVQNDSVNFGGARSSSATYTAEDTAGEVATGYSNSSNYNNHAGYQQNTNTSSGGGTSGGGENTASVGGFGFSGGNWLINVSNFKASSQYPNVLLNWDNPSGYSFDSVIIVRSDKFFPKDPFGTDGVIIYQGKDSSFLDKSVKENTVYYYSIFAKSDRGEYSSGALTFIKLLSTKEATSTQIIIDSGSVDPFANIPQSLEVNKVISDLKLSDFDFLQNGKKIKINGNKINIDGSKSLLISLNYNKVPEILKTIAVSFISPGDSSRVFSFLLRVNKDKTAYEATIAPLGMSGNYGMNVTILDYKNQSLKRLKGELQAMALNSTKEFILSGGENLEKLFIVVILGILFVFELIRLISRFFLNRKQNYEN